MVSLGIPSTGGSVESSARQLVNQYKSAFGSGDIAALVDGLSGLPITRVRHTHGYYIRGPYGIVLGGVERVQETQSQSVEGIYTVGRAMSGSPSGDARGVQDGRRLQITRLDLTSSAVEEAFGFEEWSMLCDNIGRFTLRPSWTLPAGYALSGQPTYEYLGCVIVEQGRTIEANGSRVSRANVTIQFTEKVKISSFQSFDSLGV